MLSRNLSSGCFIRTICSGVEIRIPKPSTPCEAPSFRKCGARRIVHSSACCGYSRATNRETRRVGHSSRYAVPLRRRHFGAPALRTSRPTFLLIGMYDLGFEFMCRLQTSLSRLCRLMCERVCLSGIAYFSSEARPRAAAGPAATAPAVCPAVCSCAAPPSLLPLLLPSAPR